MTVINIAREVCVFEIFFSSKIVVLFYYNIVRYSYYSAIITIVTDKYVGSVGLSRQRERATITINVIILYKDAAIFLSPKTR